MRGYFENLIGKKYYELTVIERIQKKNKRYDSRWLCQCSCGKTTEADAKHLKSGGIKSCGHLKGEYRPFHQQSVRWNGYGDIPGMYFTRLKKSAESRGLEFDITIEYIWKLYLKQDKKCALSGEEIFFSHQKDRINFTASLDRIDSAYGYIEGNVQWLHKWVNLMKSNMTDHEFIEWCEKISEYSGCIKED